MRNGSSTGLCDGGVSWLSIGCTFGAMQAGRLRSQSCALALRLPDLENGLGRERRPECGGIRSGCEIGYTCTMARNPYERFRGENLGMTDYLAIDRTELANERTLLAYVRTAIALLITGGSAIKFFDAWWVGIAGAGFVFASFVVVLVGWWRYRSVKRRMAAALERQAGEAAISGREA